MPTKSPTTFNKIEIGIGIRTPILSKKAQDIKQQKEQEKEQRKKRVFFAD